MTKKRFVLSIIDEDDDQPPWKPTKLKRPPNPAVLAPAAPVVKNEQREHQKDSLVIVGRELPLVPDEQQGGEAAMKRRDRNEMKPTWKQEILDDKSRPVHPFLLAQGTTSWQSLNTDTKEGFQPQAFVSSRGNRAKLEQKLEDFMDADDNRAGVAGYSGKVEAHNLSQDVFAGFGAAQTSIIAKAEPLGEKLFRRMTIKRGQDDGHEPIYSSAPELLVHFYDASRGSRGLGNWSTQRASAAKHDKGMGLGVLNDDLDNEHDIDVYDDAPMQLSHEVQDYTHQKGTVLNGFIRATDTGDGIVPLFRHFAPPTVPKDWKPRVVFEETKMPYDPWPKKGTQAMSRTHRRDVLEEEALLVPPAVNLPAAAVTLDLETLQAALSTKSIPFTDAEKMKRYRSWLAFQVASGAGKVLSAAPEVEKGEESEFSQVARVFRPLQGYFSQRFTTATGDAAVPSDAKSAATMGMYGTLTRSVKRWFPSRVLCKRMGVRVPWTDEELREAQLESDVGFAVSADGPNLQEDRNVQNDELDDQNGDLEETWEEGEQEAKIENMPSRPTMDIFQSIFGGDSDDEVKQEPVETAWKPKFIPRKSRHPVKSAGPESVEGTVIQKELDVVVKQEDLEDSEDVEIGPSALDALLESDSSSVERNGQKVQNEHRENEHREQNERKKQNEQKDHKDSRKHRSESRRARDGKQREKESKRDSKKRRRSKSPSRKGRSKSPRRERTKSPVEKKRASAADFFDFQ